MTDRSPSGTSTNYVYSSLPTPTSIRLLRRLDDDENGLISISLETFDLAAKVWLAGGDAKLPGRPPYHALSYTWGNPHAEGNGLEDFRARNEKFSPENLLDIKCNGKILRIGRNLHDFFRQVPPHCMRMNLTRLVPKFGMTSIHDISTSDSSGRLHMYVSEGVDVNVTDKNGRTPLHYAARSGKLLNTKILVKGGAILDHKDDSGQTAADLALTDRHHDTWEFLTTYRTGAGPTAIHDVADFAPYGSDRYIWIDAVCIDQSNLEERSSQVRLMKRIYNNARYVIIWLGEEDKHTDAARSAISKLVPVGAQYFESPLRPFGVYRRDEYARFSVPYISEREWKSLAALYLRQWFRRIWVIQEASFALNIYMFCGRKEIDWNELEILTRLFNRKAVSTGNSLSTKYIPKDHIASSVEQHFSYISGLRHAQRQLHGTKTTELAATVSMVALVRDSCNFRATDPRDKIYALASFWDAYDGTGSQPDYTCSVADCYTKFFKEASTILGDFSYLGYVHDRSVKQTPQLPSWVPDFSLSGLNSLPNHFNAQGHLAENRTAFRRNLLFRLTSINELSIVGVCIDTIGSTAASRLKDGPRKLELDQSWFDLLQVTAGLGAYDNLTQSYDEVLWRTLCADTGLNEHSPAPDEYGNMFKRLLCAMICSKLELSFREAVTSQEDQVTLIALLELLASMSEKGLEGPQQRGPDEATAARLRQELLRPQRSIASEYCDCVRDTLNKLGALRDICGGKYIPTVDEVNAYFAEDVPPINEPNGFTAIPDDFRPFALSHAKVYGLKRLFSTKKGYLGLGPGSLEPGDHIWIVQGCNKPLILRVVESVSQTPHPIFVPGSEFGLRIDVEGPRFELIGEAYIHGIMGGEAASQVKKEDLIEVTLV